MNMGNLQKLQQQMMQELGRIQEELKVATVEGSAGGGVVKAVATGEQKLVQRCQYPLTGTDCVDVVVTDLCVLRRSEGAFHLVQVADGFTADEIVALTELPLVEP